MLPFVIENYLLSLQIFLVLNLVSNSKCNAPDSSWNWTHPVEKTTMNDKGSLFTIDHIKFKRCPFHYNALGSILQETETTKLKCGIFCMEHPQCVTWIFDIINAICYLYDYRFPAYPLKNFLSDEPFSHFDCYEIEVIFFF